MGKFAEYFDGTIDWPMTNATGMVVRRVAHLDSTTPAPRLATPHVHVRPETAPAPRRTASDQAAGYGEHERDH